jgi:uncharacterized membrane protein
MWNLVKIYLMLRQKLIDRQTGAKKGFRWRGHEISRIEGLSDAVSAFAITLLVVSLEVPRTFNDLMETMRGFFGFAITFVMLFQVWFAQYLFFRRYALVDAMSVVLNGILLFVVLFYVYPLKFLCSLLMNELQHGSDMVRGHDGKMELMIEPSQAPLLMSIYGAGFIAVFGIFALLYAHAYRKRHELELNELEIFDTYGSILPHALNIVVGIVALVVSLTPLSNPAAASGMVYWITLPIGHTVLGVYRGRKRRLRFQG